MTATLEAPTKSISNLEDLIAQAMKRVNVSKEAKLCRYIPHGAGFIHHFTYNKLKKQNPQELTKVIKKHILENDQPKMQPSKPRAKRGSRSKKSIVVEFSLDQINRLHVILKKEGDGELLALVSPHQSAKELQKRMLEMVKQKQVDPELWEAYANLIQKEASAS